MKRQVFHRRLFLAAAAALTLASPALAQAWPTKPVKLVVPYPPGGNVDVAARILAEKLQQDLGQPVIVENKSGAGGLIGSEAVAKADPDGYTMLLGANGPILFAPELVGRPAYDWRKDFIPVTAVTLTPLVLQVNPSVPAKTIKEFFVLAAKTPQTMASPGAGTTNHLLSELMQAKLSMKWTTVQYRGNAPATNDVVGGHVHFNLDQISVALPFVTSGKTRALAITGTARFAGLPDVPTFAEAGYPDFDGQTFTGLMLPAKTPDAIVEKLHAATIKALAEPTTKTKILALGSQAAPMSRAEFTAYLDKEDRTWLPLIRKLGIKAE